MFEHHKQPLISKKEFTRRMARFAGAAFLLVGVSWLIGILGYRILEGFSWIDSMLNAAMILGGMGPVNQLETNGGKVFASFYALFSGIVFLVAVGVLLAPVIHRFLHKFYIQPEKENKKS
jgi:ABC-type phosphate transport system permease subunit